MDRQSQNAQAVAEFLAGHDHVDQTVFLEEFRPLETFGKILLGGTASPPSLGDWIEIVAAFGLFLGVFLGAMLLRDSLERSELAEGRLRELSGAFMDLVDGQFAN